MDARGEVVCFQIYRRGATAFEAAASDGEGFRHSAVFKQWFRLTRRRDRRGGWAFDLERRGGQRLSAGSDRAAVDSGEVSHADS